MTTRTVSLPTDLAWTQAPTPVNPANLFNPDFRAPRPMTWVKPITPAEIAEIVAAYDGTDGIERVLNASVAEQTADVSAWIAGESEPSLEQTYVLDHLWEAGLQTRRERILSAIATMGRELEERLPVEHRTALNEARMVLNEILATLPELHSR